MNDYDKLKKYDAELVLISPSDEEKTKEFLKIAEDKLSFKAPFPVLIDSERKVVKLYGVLGNRAIPSVFVIDKRGMLRFKYIGQDATDRPPTEHLIEMLEIASQQSKPPKSAAVEPAKDALRQEIAKVLEDFTRVDWNSRQSMYHEVLSDKAWKVRLNSEKALIALGKPAVPLLVEALSSENPHIRALVSLVLGILGDRAAVSPLMARLQDNDETVRLYTVEALGRLRDASAQKALEKAQGDKSSYVANYAELALKRLKGEVKTTKEAAPVPSHREAFVMTSESLKEQFLNTLDESAWDAAQLNKAAPDFNLLDSDGNQVSLKDYKGKKHVVLVFLLADW